MQTEVNEGSAILYLYGSRADDAQKGGDIDLLLLFENQKSASETLAKKHNLLAEIKKLIGDQKIDLKITYKQAISDDPFLKTRLPKAIALHKW